MHQLLQNRDIGRRKVTYCDFPAAHPCKFFMSLRDWLTAPCLDPIGEEANGDVGVAVLGLGEQMTDRHIEAEFLFELSSKTGFGRLARLDFATGELPLAFERVPRGATRQEDPPVPQEDCGRDVNRWSTD
jgi:hypothetical protein